MNKKVSKKQGFLYKNIATQIQKQIHDGILQPNSRIPSIRKLSKTYGVNKSTIEFAFAELETLGLVYAKPQSGYYVKAKTTRTLPETDIINIETTVSRFRPGEAIEDLQELAIVPDVFSLGAAIPAIDVLPIKKLGKIVSKIGKDLDPASIDYQFPPGYYKLRKELAKFLTGWGCNFLPEDMIVTSGAMDTISLCLRAVTKPGDTVIVESPTYTLVLLLLQSLGLNILEVPTHPREGIYLPALKNALDKHNVSSCILYPTLNNPTGSIIPQKKRKEIYNLFSAKNIPIIEANVHSELCFDGSRPSPIKSLDTKGLVLYVYSFSKTVAPGYRVAIVAPGRYRDKLNRLKLMNAQAVASIPQIAIAEFIKSGGYEKSLRNLRKIFSSRLTILGDLVSEYFPDGCRFSRPKGGYFLWIELPKHTDVIKLQRIALDQKISFGPGPMFSSKKELYLNFMRLSCAVPHWSVNKAEHAIEKLGKLI